MVETDTMLRSEPQMIDDSMLNTERPPEDVSDFTKYIKATPKDDGDILKRKVTKKKKV